MSEIIVIGKANALYQTETASVAQELGKTLYVFPTNAGEPYANNKLIKNGAYLIETEADVE